MTKLGLFCMPVNPMIKSKIKDFMFLDQRIQLVYAFKALIIILCLSVLAGMVTVGITQWKHKGVIKVCVGMGAGSLLFLAIYIAFYTTSDRSSTKYVLTTLLIFVATLLLYNLITVPSSLYVHGSLLRFSTFVACKKKYVFVYIVLFCLATIGALSLFIAQMTAVWSSADIVFNPNEPFFTLVSKVSKFLTAIYVFHLLWTLCIIKETCKCVITQTTISFLERESTGSSG